MSDDKTVVRTVVRTIPPLSFALKGLRGAHKDKIYRVGKNLNVGREQDNDIVINEGFVSRYHANLQMTAGVLTVVDNQSANGTCVNDQLIEGVTVVDYGDTIKFDVIDFAVVEYNATEAQNTSAHDETKLRVSTAKEDESLAVTEPQDDKKTVFASIDDLNADASDIANKEPQNQDQQKTVIEPVTPLNKKSDTLNKSDSQATKISTMDELSRARMDQKTVVAKIKQAAAQAAAPVELLGLSSPVAHRTFKLSTNVQTIGRSPFNDIILKSSSVSSEHAEIENVGEHWVVRDLGSSNGTFVNGEPIDECDLYHQDLLIFGEVELKFDPNGLVPAPELREPKNKTSNTGSSTKLWLVIAAVLVATVVGITAFLP
jgi:pSer/pThr/pTyr-binding forkhead associated (FHA) protein